MITGTINEILAHKGPQLWNVGPDATVFEAILNQSHVVMMFQSGAGVEVIENKHYMAARVFLPWEFVVSTFEHFLSF